jgi:ABC-type antimicrobial peptide transport system permease subunit
MREIGLWILAGIALGIPVTLEGGRLVQKMLYGLSGTDALSFSIAVATLLSSGLLAGYLPARRASRIDPAVALRNE